MQPHPKQTGSSIKEDISQTWNPAAKIKRMKHKNANPKKNTAKSAPSEPPPNWPPFKPLLPPSDLYLEPIVDSQIIVTRNFWTSTLCKDYVSFLRSLPLVTTPGKPKKGDAVRVNDRFQITDPAFANRLWLETGLRELVNGRTDEEEEDESMSKEERTRLWYVPHVT
jgi:hypothetical protein